jgi:hypothetical protein
LVTIDKLILNIQSIIDPRNIIDFSSFDKINKLLTSFTNHQKQVEQIYFKFPSHENQPNFSLQNSIDLMQKELNSFFYGIQNLSTRFGQSFDNFDSLIHFFESFADVQSDINKINQKTNCFIT